MTSMPEVGSKISLVSKADIRYEGRLFTVDPQECTIALANVRSFGTEDRETPYPIPPQPTVYDYILFRGSDIKDIRVINNVAIPNDPAIMQMHLPPQQNFSQNFSPMQHSNTSQSFGPFGHMSGNLPSSIGQNLVPSQQQQPSSQQQNHSPIRQQQDSRSGTPQNVLRKSPSSEVGGSVQRDNQAANKDKGPRNNQNQIKNNQQRDKRDSPRHVDQENKGGYKNQRSNQSTNQMQNHHQQQQHPQHQHQQQQRGGYRNNNNNGNKINNNHQHQQQGQGRMIQGGTNRIRNNYNSKPLNNKPNGVQRGNNKPNTLKFENEFDFEQGNNKFEEIRSQLSKLKVGEEAKTEQVVNQNQVVNGDAEKKEDSGNETGADHEIECDDKSGYDKTKSFFDNISCEAVERSKGKMQRTDWRQERKINTETFGFSSNRRGNYRGRPQNMRGGSRPNNYYYRYNNQNSYRPRNNNSNNRNNQTNAGQNSSGANQPTQQKPSANVAAK